MTNKEVSIHSVTEGQKHHFFGFHDLCPWDESGRFMLAMETDFIDRSPKAEDKARICVIDTQNNNALEVIAETRAWNFHQGCRAQWLPNKQGEIIYNDRRSDRFVSVVFDTRTKKEIATFDYPVYVISPDGSSGLGLNFEWLNRHGGYGYALFGGTSDAEKPIPTSFEETDGIFRVDLKTGETKLIISIHDIAHLNNSPKQNEHHILTHITFNPFGSRICFLDKYRLPDGGFMQRPVTANPDGSDVYVLPGHVTHYDWKNDTEILGYGKFSPRIMDMRNKGILKNPLLKPLLEIGRSMRGTLKQKIAGQSYLLLKDKTQEVKRIAVGVMTEDGHPQFSPDGKWVITDTYPDKNHEQTLILYDWEGKKKIELEKFRSLPEELPDSWDISEMRSDLHPRWDRSGKKVCVDSVDEGTRQMYVVDVSKHIR
ncbi:MAG: hypothetical protein Q8R20_01730 [Nanoarchaeota archaeon]|nr:hypothetical protein [Nanoarchaeota archaeon]